MWSSQPTKLIRDEFENKNKKEIKRKKNVDLKIIKTKFDIKNYKW